MTKLTKYQREQIVGRAVAAAFKARAEAHASEEDALAREAFNAVIPANEQALANGLPEGWLRLDNCLRFNVGGQDITLNLIGDGVRVPYAPRGQSGSYYCNRLGTIEHGDLCDRIQHHAMAGERIKEERRAAQRATKSMLENISTVAKLKDAWPEGAEFYSDIATVTPPTLPAIRVDEVNSLLGLPLAA